MTTDTDRRGAQVFAHELASVLGDSRCEVRTVALTAGARGPQLPFDVLGRHRLSPVTLTRLRQAVGMADVVVGYGSSTLYACALVTLGSRTPFIYRSIGDLKYWANTRARQRRVRASLHRADAIVALWPQAARTITEVFGVPGDRVRVIPRGVDEDSFQFAGPEDRAAARRTLAVSDDVDLACLVGSLTPEKGIDVAFKAAVRVPGLHLVVAGDGPLRDELEALAARLLPGRVRFIGRVADTRTVYSASDLLLLTSWSEGVPGVVIEAGLVGRPAVATDVGGTASIIADGQTGYLRPPGEVSAIAQAIERAISEKDHLGRAARELYSHRFSLRLIASRWERLLQETVV